MMDKKLSYHGDSARRVGGRYTVKVIDLTWYLPIESPHVTCDW